MAKSLTWFAPITKILPPDEPIARLMARLFVLWQDLLFEQAGIMDDDGFTALDRIGNSEHQLHRRLYFLRANSRTLSSACKLFDKLRADPTFSSWLDEDPNLSKEFSEAKKAFDQHRQQIDRVRNTIGAHAEESVGDAIQWFKPDDQARFEIHSEDFMRPHLATEILLSVLMGNAPQNERLAVYRAAVKPLALATGAMIKTMSIAADVYFQRFGLYPD